MYLLVCLVINGFTIFISLIIYFVTSLFARLQPQESQYQC